MKKFCLLSPLRDAADAYVSALQGAGYEMTLSIEEANFILFEKEPRDLLKWERLENLIRGKPAFIYPHTPYAFWLWDGVLEPLPVDCNFVSSQAACLGMAAYGYPNRVENCGFPRCEVRDFKPTHGKNLLYSSSRLLNNNHPSWPHKADKDLHYQAMNWIVNHRGSFERVIVNYSFSLKDNGLDEFAGYDIEFVELGNHRELGARTALEQFKGIDIVITCNTFGYLAIASGIPTVLFGHNDKAGGHSSAGLGGHYEKYKSYYEFPLDLFSMSARDVLDLRLAPNGPVEAWKNRNIGFSFNADAFLSTVQEYL